MKKKMANVILTIFLLIACGADPVVVTPTPRSTNNWWKLWLDTPICVAPCWAGITPGVTSADDAYSILQNMSDVKVVFRNKYGVDWRFDGARTDSGTLSSSPSGIVSAIHIGNSTEEDLLLEKVIASYGDPTFIKPYDCREGMCAVILVYPDSGMFLEIFVENSGDRTNYKIEIQPISIIWWTVFFSPGIESFEAMPEYKRSDPIKWKGYGEYP